MTTVAPALSIRIIADDLTGALDAAAPLAARHGIFTVGWGELRAPGDERAAFDTETRDADPLTAISRTAAAAELWWRGFTGLAFKKVDSVWRGHAAAEIAAAMTAGGFECAVVAPAFPAQGRLTREGAQWVASAGGPRCVAPDLVANLRAAGLSAAREHAADTSARVWVCDASDQGALAAIVERHARAGAHVLWCGSAGLAYALARTLPGIEDATERQSRVSTAPTGPVLVLVGTDHPVTQAQAEALAGVPGIFERWIDLDGADNRLPSAVTPDDAPIVLVRFVVRPDAARVDVRARARRALVREVAMLPRPRLAIVTGGETLYALGEALGATALTVDRERYAGVAHGAWADGGWAGVPVLSKSGGFGAQDLLVTLASNVDGTSATPHAVVRNN